MPRRKKMDPTGLTVKELPLAWFHRQLLWGSAEQMRETINVAEHAILTGDRSRLKDGVDPIALMQEQCELLGQCKLLLRLDDEARDAMLATAQAQAEGK